MRGAKGATMQRGIITAADLPAVDTAESISLDFKVVAPLKNGFELAKDIAVFANARGGTLLVGAKEKASRLERYVPLSQEVCDQTVRAYEEAVRDRCRPAPVFTCQRVPKDGGFLVAVNVQPTLSPLVSVRTKCDDGYAGDAWCFPMRVGTQTVFITPENLPMYMDPKVRRTVILLGEIGDDLVELARPASAGMYTRSDHRLIGVHEQQNIVQLSNADLPLDRIESVFCQSSGEARKWVIICPH
jgi:hypothetical protein